MAHRLHVDPVGRGAPAVRSALPAPATPALPATPAPLIIPITPVTPVTQVTSREQGHGARCRSGAGARTAARSGGTHVRAATDVRLKDVAQPCHRSASVLRGVPSQASLPRRRSTAPLSAAGRGAGNADGTQDEANGADGADGADAQGAQGAQDADGFENADGAEDADSAQGAADGPRQDTGSKPPGHGRGGVGAGPRRRHDRGGRPRPWCGRSR
ncbi:hypothetical protein GCM10018793_40070 [Streptomyces sulfonofaciens]|uniref:Uncharacterized protein n=1 Tax=Streptomyces sulfonofaciens TaxID=68272 RepID=A0A919GCU8_9ACTN|nr:hypothetical protein GCM10018793_40070 [Streptomyces sulfonofaciens]